MDLEVELDRYLKIKTNGRDDSESNFVNFPYEPTPYSVLQSLANSGYVNKHDVIIDFGCGKGRVDFFLAYSTKAKMIGVELNKRLYNSAMKNLESAISSNRVSFVNCNASEYKVPSIVTGAYFFNPFSIEVLDDVVNNLRLNKKESLNDIKLFFYYPSKDYLKYLDSQEDIFLIDKIMCMEQFKELDEREYIVIYKL